MDECNKNSTRPGTAHNSVLRKPASLGAAGFRAPCFVLLPQVAPRHCFGNLFPALLLGYLWLERVWVGGREPSPSTWAEKGGGDGPIDPHCPLGPCSWRPQAQLSALTHCHLWGSARVCSPGIPTPSFLLTSCVRMSSPLPQEVQSSSAQAKCSLPTGQLLASGPHISAPTPDMHRHLPNTYGCAFSEGHPRARVL